MLAGSPLPSYRRFSLLPPACFPTALTEDMVQATFEFNYANEAQSFQTPQELFTSLIGSTSFPDFSEFFNMEDKPRLPDSSSKITPKYVPKLNFASMSINHNYPHF